MNAFACKTCHRRSYSASADARAPCVYCGVGAVEKLDALPENPVRLAAPQPKAATNR